MHMEEVTIGYGMTETSPVSTQTAVDDPLDKRVIDGRPCPSARRDQGRRPGDGRDRSARHAGRAVHARLQRDARLLGQRGGDPSWRSTRKAGCTPATSPSWTRRATVKIVGRHQGHDHPRRREHLPARDRGVPAHGAGRERGVRDRRPERALRRGGDGLGQASRRGRRSARKSWRPRARGGSPPSRSLATGSSSTRSR